MELSQASLAMLALGAFPLGVLISVAYRIGAPSALTKSVWIRTYANLRDFVFMIIAGVLTVILVYYVNDGEYRYLAPLGAIGGFLLGDMLLREPIIKARAWLIRGLVRILSVPIAWVLQKTYFPFRVRISENTKRRYTEKRIELMMQLASNGFENNTEAKE